MRAAHVIPLVGFVTMLSPSPSVVAQEDRLRAAVQAHAQARTRCAIIVLEATPTDERFVIHPPGDITPATRTLEPGCVPSHVIPAPRTSSPSASATRGAAPLVAPQFSVPAARLGQPPAHPLTDGLADGLKPR